VVLNGDVGGGDGGVDVEDSVNILNMVIDTLLRYIKKKSNFFTRSVSCIQRQNLPLADG
jgi:hypothetical protein